MPSFRGKKALMLDNSRMTIHYHSSCHIYSLRSNIYEAVVHYGRKTVCRGLIDWACNVIDRSIKADRSVNNLPVCSCVFVCVFSSAPLLRVTEKQQTQRHFPSFKYNEGRRQWVWQTEQTHFQTALKPRRSSWRKWMCMCFWMCVCVCVCECDVAGGWERFFEGGQRGA